MRIVSEYKKTLLLTLLILLIGALALGGLYFQSATYLISDGENGKEITTRKGTVAEVLAAAEIKVSEHDLISPALNEPVENGTEIKITRAKPYQVLVETEVKQIFSTATNFQNVLSSVEAKNVALPLNHSNETPLLAADGKLNFKDGEKETAVELTATDTLATALTKADLQLSAIDEVALTNANGKLSLDIVRVTRGNVSEEIEIPVETQVRETASLYEGQERVVSEGAAGTTKITYYRHLRGGQKVVDKEIGRTTAVEAQPRIIEKGTKKRPRENQATTNATQNEAGQPAPTAVSGDIWSALAQCESGGNPATNSGNGYYGMYQFSLPTWQAVGGTGLPSEASAAEQTHRAQILQARAGWGQWPACARKLGLL
ncbi:transglycosylase family protein [Gleimia sp. 6138-11-ORH1]|uniref:transglycosylase family protein n=1 Tax=Gleimia sp. 6138-11-ORH1 TaxID=2973937 RepID=UPI00286DE28A|nr:transglycosylase family protein [Gleimia sp. 6138-11-ORH1]